MSSPGAPCRGWPQRLLGLVSKAESFGWESSEFGISYCPTASHCAELSVKIVTELNDLCNLIFVRCICLQLSTSTMILFLPKLSFWLA